MDTSKEYIKMCEKAEEIQKLWKPTVADFHTSYDWKEFHTVEFDYDSSKIDILGCPPHIWLPRQDQLQEMVKSDTIINWDFYHFINDGLTDYLDYFNSMEQLWLAFVMKEKYNKTWNGEDWVIE